MTAHLSPEVVTREVVQTRAFDDDGVAHIVCHCTDDAVAACGLDVADSPWDETCEEPDCPLCRLRWPLDAAACPWGCSCSEECGPDL